MISRLLKFIICPECHHSELSLKIIKKGNKVTLPFQQFEIKEYLKYRDLPNISLLLDFRPNTTWVVWSENNDYLVNVGPDISLKGNIISSYKGTYPLYLKGILNSKIKIVLNNKNIGIFHTSKNDLLDLIHLGKHSLHKGINTIELILNNSGKINYVHRDHIHLNQKHIHTQLKSNKSRTFHQDISEGIITCKKCRSAFPIINGIPLLLKNYLLSTYITNQKIPKNILKHLKKSQNINKEDLGKKYKISEISVEHNRNLPQGFFESFKHHPFIPHDSQRSQEKLLSYSLLVYLLNPKLNEIIFDSAAGAGWTSKFLSKLGCEVISADINFDYLNSGKSNSAESFFHRIVCDSENIPITNKVIDSVFSYDSFHHMPDKSTCVRNFYNILKPGGRMVFYEPKAVHNTNYFSQMVMDQYSILEEGFTQKEFYEYLGNISVKDPIFIDTPYFKDTNIIILDKVGYKNFTSISPGILRADYSVTKIKKKHESISLDIRIKNSGNTTWLYTKKPSTPGATYIKVIAFDVNNNIITQKFFSLNSHVLPATEHFQKITLKNIDANQIKFLEIDMTIFDISDFKYAHGGNSLKIKV